MKTDEFVLEPPDICPSIPRLDKHRVNLEYASSPSLCVDVWKDIVEFVKFEILPPLHQSRVHRWKKIVNHLSNDKCKYISYPT
jgi:hypothetical protein